MSMGYMAVHITTVTVSDLKALNMPSFNHLLEALQANNVSMDALADDRVENDETLQHLDDCLMQFVNDFQQQYGIGIDIDYHDTMENGSTYDDINGAFFALENSDLYTYTDKAKVLSRQLNFHDTAFVSYG